MDLLAVDRLRERRDDRLDEIPVIGKIFSLAGGGSDTLDNPDSYSHFAQER